MACGCRSGRRSAQVSGVEDAVAGGRRGVQRSRVEFVVLAAGVERVFGSLREARVVADRDGGQVVPRRVALG